MSEIKLHDADQLDSFEQPQDPSEYETHELIEDSIRGPKGAVVSIHKNDLAILRANGLIAKDGEPLEPAKQAKAEKPAKQAKAEKAIPQLAALSADTPAGA